MNEPNAWQMHEDEHLSVAFRGGIGTHQIARDLKRGVNSVRRRIVILGLRRESGIASAFYGWSQHGYQCPVAASKALEARYIAVAAKRGWHVHDYARAA
jgi:hypothetical protein